MPGLNRVQLIGRLGRDPETRLTTTGRKVCTFTLAVDRRFKSDEVWKTETDWFNLEAWGHLAEVCQQYLKKGQLVFAEGRLHTERYEAKGETRYFTKVVLSSVQMLGKPRQEPEIPTVGDDVTPEE